MSCHKENCNACEDTSILSEAINKKREEEIDKISFSDHIQVHEHDHDHAHDEGDKHTHEHEHSNENKKLNLILLTISVTLFIIGLLLHSLLESFPFSWPLYLVFMSAYVISGHNVLRETLENIRHGQIFDEYFLMTIATIGAILTSSLDEAVGVMIFFNIGELIEDASIERSKKSISALLDIQPSYANIIEDDCFKQVRPEDVKIGNIFVVKPGEKVPLDGIIIEGGSTFDTSALTGESKPKTLQKNEEILAGFINISNSITVRATKLYENTSLVKILHLVQEAEENKSETTKFISKFAKYYTPIVVFSALAIAFIPQMFTPEADLYDWIYRALIFLVISCPCALVISVPLGYFGGIGGASKHGILIKGTNYIDLLAKLDTFLFDKTGTITKGNFAVTEITTVNGFSEDKMLELAALVENFSTHPIAKSVVDAYGKELDVSKITEFSEVPAHGIRAKYDGKQIFAGNDKILHKYEIPHHHSYCIMEGTVVHVSYDGEYLGFIMIQDEIKDEALEMVNSLRNLGIQNMIMLSGDEECIVEGVSGELSLDQYYYGLLPEEKVKILKDIKEGKEQVAFVGDGINDAPVLANSDVGIVMGALGSDAAIETANIVIMNDNLDSIPLAIEIARKTRNIIWQNIIIVFLIKAFFLVFGALGMATMWAAVFADVGVALIAIFNASRILRFKKKK